jgi:hypothetical protein
VMMLAGAGELEEHHVLELKAAHRIVRAELASTH